MQMLPTYREYVGPEMVKMKFFKSSRMDLPVAVLSGPGIGSMELVSFWPFPMVVGMKQPLRTRWLLCSSRSKGLVGAQARR